MAETLMRALIDRASAHSREWHAPAESEAECEADSRLIRSGLLAARMRFTATPDGGQGRLVVTAIVSGVASIDAGTVIGPFVPNAWRDESGKTKHRLDIDCELLAVRKPWTSQAGVLYVETKECELAERTDPPKTDPPKTDPPKSAAAADLKSIPVDVRTKAMSLTQAARALRYSTCKSEDDAGRKQVEREIETGFLQAERTSPRSKKWWFSRLQIPIG